MPLVPLEELLISAQANHYAVPAINVGNYESLCAVIEAAEAERAPVIVQIYKRLVEHGITKINIATECQALFLEESKIQLDRQEGHFLPIDVLMKPVVAKLVEFVRAKMSQFGASGQTE